MKDFHFQAVLILFLSDSVILSDTADCISCLKANKGYDYDYDCSSKNSVDFYGDLFIIWCKKITELTFRTPIVILFCLIT